MQYALSHVETMKLATAVAADIVQFFPTTPIRLYAIPRGGIPAAYLVMNFLPTCQLVSNPNLADAFIDDIIDSGSTMTEWCDRYPGKPFFALVNKLAKECALADHGVIFPWESVDRETDDTIVGTIRNRILDAGASSRERESVGGAGLFEVNAGERQDLGIDS